MDIQIVAAGGFRSETPTLHRQIAHFVGLTASRLVTRHQSCPIGHAKESWDRPWAPPFAPQGFQTLAELLHRIASKSRRLGRSCMDDGKRSMLYRVGSFEV